MNKKTVAYILMAVVGLSVLVYLLMKWKGRADAAAMGAGLPDNRGAWAAEDDALYAKLRGMFTANEKAWLDPLAEQAYTTGVYGDGVPCNDDVKIKGVASKAGSFACVVYGVGPNAAGTYPPVHWAPNMPSLWPQSTYDKLFNSFNQLKAKYGGL